MSLIIDRVQRITARMERCREVLERRWHCVLIDEVPRDPFPGSRIIYAFRDGVGGVLRGGRTEQKLGDRVSRYKPEPWFSEAKKLCYTVVEPGEEVRSIEEALIGCTCPPHNKQQKNPYCPID